MAMATPDYVEMSYDKGWLAILVIASIVMILAVVTTCVFKVLRRGPDVLDRMSALLRDHPYVRIKGASNLTYSFGKRAG